MDPVTMGIVSAGLGAIGTGVTAIGQSNAMRQQAAADQQRADIEAKWTERRTQEETASAQRQASEEHRKAALAQSRLMAVAGASGSSPSDETVMKLWGDISKEGDLNARNVMAGAAQKTAGMTYQSGLDRWAADSNAAIKRSSANSTLIGGLLSGASQFGTGYYNSRMAARYSTGGTSGGTGYG